MKVSFTRAGTQPKARGSTLLFMLVAGSIFMATGLFMQNLNHIDPGWVKTQGTVTKAIAESGMRASITWTLVVEYTVHDQRYTVTGNIGSSFFDPQAGDKQEIAYNASRPAQSKLIDDGIFERFASAFFLLAGIGVILLAFWQLYKR